MIVFKQQTSCNGTGKFCAIFFDDVLAQNGAFSVNGMLQDDGTFTALPSWILTFTATNFYANLSGVIPDVYVFGFTRGADIYLIEITVTDDCTVATHNNPICTPDNTQTHIVWLSREGGYENYIFSGKRFITETGTGDSETTKTFDLIKKNAQTTGIYRAVTVSTGVVPREHLVKLESLCNSVQAWVFDDTLPFYYDWSKRFKEIILDRQTFSTGDTNERMVERSIKYFIAKELITQVQ